MSNNIRIRTTPNGSDNYISLKIEQDFDFIEILSLKISQEKAYESFCADYGVLVGRVTINNGFGVPNVKVSIFIPVDEDDKANPTIRGLYPYETVNDTNSDGIVYNLLPKDNQTSDTCYVPVGSFPSKGEILDNNDVLYVYEKYYKYTAITNTSGDYMIFGVPLGAQVAHIDADISDIGFLSQKPFNLIDQGVSPELFSNGSQFKKSKKLSTLAQIKSSNNGVNIRPFWGDIDNCQIGINRFDYDLNIDFTPSAFFIGSLFGDTEKNSVNKNCRPRAKSGVLCEQVAGPGMIEMIRKTPNGGIEKFDINPTDQITDDGTWAYQIPMNLDYVVTDEFGNIIPSKDPNVGIPTRADVRFRISMLSETGRIRARGKYLIPHNPTKTSEIDFNFDSQTKNTSFATLYWDKIYTVKSFIPRLQKFGGKRTNNYLGIKNIDQCTTKNQFPFNRADTFSSIFSKYLLIFVCMFAYIIAGIVWALNTVLCTLCNIKIFGLQPFKFACSLLIKLSCSAGDETKLYTIGCGNGPTEWVDCLIVSLSADLGLYKLDFYNDWVNGTLYFPIFKAKRKRGRKIGKFCSYETSGIDNKFLDTTYMSQGDSEVTPLESGIATYYKKNFYYAPSNKSVWIKMFATDLVNLGSIRECDWQGVPRILDEFDSTTFSVPPVVEEKEEGEPTIVGMCTLGETGPKGCYFKVNCFGIKLLENGEGAMNIRRQCELFVNLLEYPEGGEPRLYLSRYELCTDIQDGDDEDRCSDSPAIFIRDIFYLLNKNGTKSIGGVSPNMPVYQYDDNLKTLSNGTSFHFNGEPTKDFGTGNGSAYKEFRGKRIAYTDDRGWQSWGNSYYFYFGLIGGSTSLELFKKKYLQRCEPLLDGNFAIRTVVTNSITSNANATDGSLEISIEGGLSPYSIVITNPTLGELELDSNGFDPTKWDGKSITIIGLKKGTYNIEVIDSTNSLVLETIEIKGPSQIICDLSIDQPSTPTCTNGSVTVSIIGGVQPYTATLKYPNVNNQNIALSPNGFTKITGLTSGQYTLMVSDSDNPKNTCEKTVTLKSTNKKLEIIDVKKTDIECDDTGNTGSISFTVTGGTDNTIVYRVTGTTYNSGWLEVTNRTGFVNELPAGDYTILVEDNKDLFRAPINGVYQSLNDSCSDIAKKEDIKIVKYLKYKIDLVDINNKKQCDPSKWTISFNLRKDPLHNGDFYLNRETKKLSVIIDSGTPVTGLPVLPTLNQIGNGYKVTFDVPSSTYSIGTDIKIRVTDVGDCESNELTILEQSIRKPDQILSIASGSYTGSGPWILTWNIIGGVPPYTISPTTSNVNPFNQPFTVTVIDSNGCTDNKQITL